MENCKKGHGLASAFNFRFAGAFNLGLARARARAFTLLLFVAAAVLWAGRRGARMRIQMLASGKTREARTRIQFSQPCLLASVWCRAGARFKEGSGGSGWSGAGQVSGLRWSGDVLEVAKCRAAVRFNDGFWHRPGEGSRKVLEVLV